MLKTFFQLIRSQIQTNFQQMRWSCQDFNFSIIQLKKNMEEEKEQLEILMSKIPRVQTIRLNPSEVFRTTFYEYLDSAVPSDPNQGTIHSNTQIMYNEYAKPTKVPIMENQSGDIQDHSSDLNFEFQLNPDTLNIQYTPQTLKRRRFFDVKEYLKGITLAHEFESCLVLPDFDPCSCTLYYSRALSRLGWSNIIEKLGQDFLTKVKSKIPEFMASLDFLGADLATLPCTYCHIAVVQKEFNCLEVYFAIQLSSSLPLDFNFPQPLSVSTRVTRKMRISTAIELEQSQAQVQLTMADKVGISRSQVCEGAGLFARTFLPIGTQLGEYTGQIIAFTQTERRANYYNQIGLNYLYEAADGKQSVDSFFYGNFTRYINHASQPRNNVMTFHRDNKLFLKTRENVVAGQELLLDYGPAMQEQFKKNRSSQR